MTDDNPNTPAGEHDPSIKFQPDYDDYGLHEQESATTVLRIDKHTGVFERIGKVESTSAGVILKQHTRLTDDVADDITEAYTPIQFISARTDRFESRVEEAIFEFVYEGRYPKSWRSDLLKPLRRRSQIYLMGYLPIVRMRRPASAGIENNSSGHHSYCG